MIDVVADDAPVIPGQAIWVAVVVVDSSGNAHIDMLTMVSASATDEGITDPGVYLPDIGKVNAAWFEQTSIFVEWEHSVDANVRGYHIYISDEMFTSTDDATKVGQTVSANSLLITNDEFEDLNNATAYYIGVVPYDDTVAKSTVESVKLNPLDGSGATTDGVSDDGPFTLESLLTTPNLIAAGMVLIVVMLLVLIVRPVETQAVVQELGIARSHLGHSGLELGLAGTGCTTCAANRCSSTAARRLNAASQRHLCCSQPHPEPRLRTNGLPTDSAGASASS